MSLYFYILYIYIYLFIYLTIICLPPRYHHITSDILRDSRSDGPLLSWNDFPQMSSGPSERESRKKSLLGCWCVDNSKVTRRSGENIQTSVVKKIKNVSFSLYVYNFNPDFQNFDFYLDKWLQLQPSTRRPGPMSTYSYLYIYLSIYLSIYLPLSLYLFTYIYLSIYLGLDRW